MRERGIIFTAESIRAIQEERKSQTRRVINPQFIETPEVALTPTGFWAYGPTDRRKDDCIRCPYGVPGDRLYCKETWQVDAPRDGTWCDTVFYGCKNSPLSWIPERYRKPEYCLYRATWEGTDLCWRSSRFMPKWAARIWRELTDVRVQRLQDITEEEAKAEGVRVPVDENENVYIDISSRYRPVDYFSWDELKTNLFRAHFAGQWDQIDGKRSPWKQSDRVWALTFRRIQ